MIAFLKIISNNKMSGTYTAKQLKQKKDDLSKDFNKSILEYLKMIQSKIKSDTMIDLYIGRFKTLKKAMPEIPIIALGTFFYKNKELLDSSNVDEFFTNPNQIIEHFEVEKEFIEEFYRLMNRATMVFESMNDEERAYLIDHARHLLALYIEYRDIFIPAA